MQPEEKFGLLVDPGAAAVQDRRHMLTHIGPVRATARKPDLLGRREQAGIRGCYLPALDTDATDAVACFARPVLKTGLSPATLSAEKIDALLRKWLRRLPPLSRPRPASWLPMPDLHPADRVIPNPSVGPPRHWQNLLRGCDPQKPGHRPTQIGSADVRPWGDQGDARQFSNPRHYRWRLFRPCTSTIRGRASSNITRRARRCVPRRPSTTRGISTWERVCETYPLSDRSA
jgi:hypothetical protein